MARHDEEPKSSDLPKAEIERAMARISSTYARSVRALLEKIRGKVVARTSTGRSGYCLEFTDGTWVICYLADALLNSRVGSGPVEQVDRDLMNDPQAGNTREPLSISYPYAEQVCDLEEQVANAVGQSVAAVAIGDTCFNICFPDGHELDASVVPDSKGVMGLRVFWEQW